MKAIVRLMTVPTEQRDLRWIEEALAAAVQLEFATIPPYLYAAWSIDPADPDPDNYRSTITGIAVEEMKHLGIAANLLAGIGGTVDMRALAPRYPSPVELPMHVHRGLEVGLRPLSRELILRTFMAIEEPEVQLAQGELDFVPSRAETIGSFYQAVSDRLGVVGPTFTKETQVDLPFFTADTWIVDDVATAQKLIALIKDQGEGTSTEPFESGAAGELAHFYQFGELYHGRRLSRTSPFAYDGAVLAFPKVRAASPARHHDPDGAAFDAAYNRMIDHLTAAWSGTAAALGDAVTDMTGSDTVPGLGELAAALFATGAGPAFRVAPPPVTAAPLTAAAATVAAVGAGGGTEAAADRTADHTGPARFSRSTGAFRVDPAVHVAYFRDLDDWSAIHATPDTAAAVTTALRVVGRAWARYVKGSTTEQDYMATVSTDAVRAAVTLLAEHQQQTVEAHYGVPLPLLALLDGYERFGNDGLPPDPQRPAEPRHNMDGKEMWFVLGGFAETCLRLGVAPDFWTFLQRPILCGLLNDGLFRGRFAVQGFEATDAGRQQVFEHAQEVADADLSAEIRQRYLDSGL